MPADSRPAKAIEFLKPVLKNLGCENVTFKVAQRENAALIELEGDGLGAIINSSRGIIAAYQQEAYAKFGAENFALASRQAVLDMQADIAEALAQR